MLTLTSPRWRELGQAFGSAEDVPRLLEALATMDGAHERMELWYGVWAMLCPEDMVYSAAYAAVPHLLAITALQAIAERAAAIHVAVAVECSRHLPGAPSIPDDLVSAYAAAIDTLPATVSELAAAPWDGPTAQVMAAALLVGKRQPVLARAVLALAEQVE